MKTLLRTLRDRDIGGTTATRLPWLRSPFARAALRSPIWWTALAVLIFNDHLLKGAGVLPEWLTGKLSDFAGLLVAPVVLMAVSGARSRRMAGACVAIPAAALAAVNLSPQASDGLVAALARLGIGWSLMPDPSDLLALTMLPLAWWLAQPTEPASQRGASRFTAAIGLAAALVACLASGREREPATWSTELWLVNTTEARVDVRLRYYRGELDCEGLQGREAEALGRDAFVDPITLALAPGRTVPVPARDAFEAANLDPPATAGQPGPAGCHAALVQAEGMDDVLVVWSNELPRTTVPATLPEEGGGPTSGRLDILAASGGLTMGAHGDVLVTRAMRDLPTSCTTGDATSWYAQTSGTEQAPALPDSATIVAIDELPDGCLDISLQSEAGLTQLTLCMPRWAFPFSVDAMLELSASDESISLTSGQLALWIYRGLPNGLTWASEEIDCVGARTACGAFVVPAAIERDGQRIEPGEHLHFEEGGVPGTVLLMRGEQVLAAPVACAGQRASVDQIAHVVIVSGKEVSP